MNLHHALDFDYGETGDDRLRSALQGGVAVDARNEDGTETLLHVAVRRRRLSAVRILQEAGADLNAQNGGGKSAYAHAIRRGFSEIAKFLAEHGADTRLNPADQLAVAITTGDLDAARRILADTPNAVRTGNAEEDRLLADVAGRNQIEPVRLLVEAGADLSATGMDDGTPLHQAGWFGQPENARLLVEAGAPLDIFDRVHESSPLGWAVHGSRYSGGAEERKGAYIALVQLLLNAGSKLEYPENGDYRPYLLRLRDDAPPWILELLPETT